MAVISWKACYEVGVGTFDDEHHVLVQVINDLYGALREKRGDEAIHGLLVVLVDYTKKHFAHEEQHMDKYKYPEVAEHKEQHVVLTDKIIDFQQQVSSGKTGLSPELMSFLRDWLLEHIVNTDKKFGAFLRENGVYDCGAPAI